MASRVLGLATWVALTVWLQVSIGYASDAGVLFARGVEHAEHGQWEAAVSVFEQALSLEDRPSVRFNLVLAYVELGRPLEVVRHALAFLALPAEAHRAAARAEVEKAFLGAQEMLARVDMRELPVTARPTVDGAEPLRDVRYAFLAPGTHRLDLMVEGAAQAEREELTLRAGEIRAWPRPTTPSAPPALPAITLPETPASAAAKPPEAPAAQPNELSLHALPETRLRRRLAWSLGLSGALGFGLGLASYAASMRAAEKISEVDPYMRGSALWPRSEDYTRWVNCVGPLAVTGSALTSAAVAVGDHTTDQRSSLWAWGALSVGLGLSAAGGVMLAREPEIIDNSGLDGPSRQAGALLLAAAMPLLTYAVTYAVRDRVDRKYYRTQVAASYLRGRR